MCFFIYLLNTLLSSEETNSVRFSLLNISSTWPTAHVSSTIRTNVQNIAGLSHSCWPPAIINPFTNWFYSAKFPTLSRKFTSDCSISQAKFSQSLGTYDIFLIIKSLKLLMSLKLCKIHTYVLYLHANRNKNMTSHWRHEQVGTRALEQNHQCSLTKFFIEVCISAISAHGATNKF